MAKKEEMKTVANVKRIKILGPKDENNQAAILRFERDDKRKPLLKLVKEQILTVGENEDISVNEADRLLKNNSWEVKEVTE